VSTRGDGMKVPDGFHRPTAYEWELRGMAFVISAMVLGLLAFAGQYVIGDSGALILNSLIALALICAFAGWFCARKVWNTARRELENGYSTLGFINPHHPPEQFESLIALVNPFTGAIICDYSLLNSAPAKTDRNLYAGYLLSLCMSGNLGRDRDASPVSLSSFELGSVESFLDNAFDRLGREKTWDLTPRADSEFVKIDEEWMQTRRFDAAVVSPSQLPRLKPLLGQIARSFRYTR